MRLDKEQWKKAIDLYERLYAVAQDIAQVQLFLERQPDNEHAIDKLSVAYATHQNLTEQLNNLLKEGGIL